MLTFGEFKETSAINIASVTPSSDAFKLLVNEATEMLIRRGDFPGCIEPMFLCLRHGCVVWPRVVGQIRKMNMCGQQVHVENSWYQFLPWDGKRWDGYRGSWSLTNYGRWAGPTAVVSDNFRSPVFQDIQGDGRTLRVFPESNLDVGKKITVFGIDTNGQPLTTKGTGVWQQGITAVVQMPYTEFSVLGVPVQVRSISRVKKDKTSGRLRLFAWNIAGAVLEDVATYDGTEISPDFLRQRLDAGCCGSNNGVLALVKLKYIPVDNDQDLIIINNRQALKFAMQAIKAREAQDIDGGDKLEMMAIRELNLDIQDQDGDAVPISLGECPNYMGAQKCF